MLGLDESAFRQEVIRRYGAQVEVLPKGTASELIGELTKQANRPGREERLGQGSR